MKPILLLLSVLLGVSATGTHVVKISGGKVTFTPDLLNITIGDMVSWINVDDVKHCHSVTFTNGRWKSPEMFFDDTWNLTFLAKGSYVYFDRCEGGHHPAKAKVVVSDEIIEAPTGFDPEHTMPVTGGGSDTTGEPSGSSSPLVAGPDSSSRITTGLIAEHNPLEDSNTYTKITVVVIGSIAICVGGFVVILWWSIKKSKLSSFGEELLLNPTDSSSQKHKLFYGS